MCYPVYKYLNLLKTYINNNQECNIIFLKKCACEECVLCPRISDFYKAVISDILDLTSHANHVLQASLGCRTSDLYS